MLGMSDCVVDTDGVFIVPSKMTTAELQVIRVIRVIIRMEGCGRFRAGKVRRIWATPRSRPWHHIGNNESLPPVDSARRACLLIFSLHGLKRYIEKSW